MRKDRLEGKSGIEWFRNTEMPQQIIGFAVAFDKSPERIQRIVDNGSNANYYCTNGYFGYVDVIYPGKHIRNVHDKSNTYTL